MNVLLIVVIYLQFIFSKYYMWDFVVGFLFPSDKDESTSLSSSIILFSIIVWWNGV